MAEEYLDYISANSITNMKDLESEAPLTYNGDVTEQDLKCWALSSKTCAIVNTVALMSSKRKKNKSWKKSIKANKKFAVFASDVSLFPPQLALTDGFKHHEQYTCVHEPGKMHILPERDTTSWSSLSVMCPSCWSTMRIVNETSVSELDVKRRRRRRAQNQRHKFTPIMMCQKVRPTRKISSATKAVRSIKKAAVGTARNSYLSPRKLDLHTVGVVSISNKKKIKKVRKNTKEPVRCINTAEGLEKKNHNVTVTQSSKTKDIKKATLSDSKPSVSSQSKTTGFNKCLNEANIQNKNTELTQDNTIKICRKKSNCISLVDGKSNVVIKYTSRGRVLKQRKRDY